ncbi:hypothetical protein X777_11831 [Ooceraea biroi]|uniref:Uncharacterized protein n=1 Tax=Ooceraea biroi TaxID=2015173 RepID=A0A026W1A0_OOCBI|nr:hypothetical protein X777_11831 [Ooceraea biroi]
MLGTGECVCECTYKPSEAYTAPKVVDPERARHKGLIHPGANAESPPEKEGVCRLPGSILCAWILPAMPSARDIIHRDNGILMFLA